MTGTYEWNPTPHCVDIICPTCGHQAEFEFAEVVRIRLKADVQFFMASKTFEYQKFEDSCGLYWHGAVFFQGLHGSPSKAIHDLPPGYTSENWEHSKYMRPNRSCGIGSLRCEQCGTRGKHRLNWPQESYYSITYRGQVLWAFNRQSAAELLNYVLSTKRETSRYRWASFLLHIPTVFKTHKARIAVAKDLQKLLAPRLGGKHYSRQSNAAQAKWAVKFNRKP